MILLIDTIVNEYYLRVTATGVRRYFPRAIKYFSQKNISLEKNKKIKNSFIHQASAASGAPLMAPCSIKSL